MPHAERQHDETQAEEEKEVSIVDAIRAAVEAGKIDLSDPGIGLFNACVKAGAPIRIDPGMTVLEVGCMEADWLHLAGRTWPDASFVGIDTRAPQDIQQNGNRMRCKANVMDDLYAPDTFDGIVSLSALEHIGLGHYGDPLDPDGDTKAIANCWRWLKPGGFFYFDVPYDPTEYRVQGTECRVYNDDQAWTRLWQEPLAAAKARARWAWQGFSEAKNASVLVNKPTQPVKPFHYSAFCWIKC